MKKIILLSIFTFTIITHSQNKEYVDDFGNELSKTEFKKFRKKGGAVIPAKKNNYSKKAIIPIEYKGQISEDLKLRVVNFLEAKSGIKISETDNIIVDYAFSMKCNVANNVNAIKYIETAEAKENLELFIVIDNYDENAKYQIVDDQDLIKNNFFRYFYWNLDYQYQCGGVLLIYTDNTFLRIYGEHNPMDIFEKLN